MPKATNSERSQVWEKTMQGWNENPEIVHAHAHSKIKIQVGHEVRSQEFEWTPNPDATRGYSGGNRRIVEPQDQYRSCFEKDRDRILHSSSFRRLAGKTQVFVFPADHQRTRLTHALEVAQVSRAISKRLGLNVDLSEAIALGHDCGHGPGGHASEDALSLFLPDGYDHAVFGADSTLTHLNLCEETLDGIRNHSWSRPEPATPEGLVVSWADRIAYCAHDLEDAINAHILGQCDVPHKITRVVGTTRSEQLNYFINSIVFTAVKTGYIAMDEEGATALGAMRQFNYESIYLRPESIRQSEQVIEVLRALVTKLISDRQLFSNLIKDRGVISLDSPDYDHKVVGYVAGMTDRYAFSMASSLTEITAEQVPRGIDF
ncbi:deoxyguanosinetriphosphate triphosphohydrolase [Acidithrix ferrooxidans]|uniref:Deoxyguanosinetriphosphate triphosphohydrolase n=2 Tax=Acidithrix ferrooxidans TaxID=1280514 RepID=A0A0D8HG51_9ACTN|nr:HD domain-containing protein [Acidithrix ferrooxidans]KJF16893.1 deoxyguanosinetriphosphate triphosphohydrolase [Acidithrix ferrooxidans]